ncbi:hypothetical protein ACQPXH_05060 [Nocardia sp. CA-135953]
MRDVSGCAWHRVDEGFRSLLLLMPRVVGRAEKMRVPEQELATEHD